MRIDMHVHTALCGHATGTVAQMAEAARAASLDVVAITDHLPLPAGFQPGYAMSRDLLPTYVADVLSVRTAFASDPAAPEILLGIEADWLPGREADLARDLDALPFDVVIGSVHFLDGWAFDDPALLDEWDRRNAGEVWRAYFSVLEQAASSGLFDVMAHPDLVKKFGHRPDFDPTPLYRSAAETFAGAGVAVEVSTAGLRKPVGEIYPSEAFLRECRDRGVPVTLGSDAHSPAEVGYRIDAAEQAVRAAGYDRVTVFRGRRAEEVPMGEACR